VILDDFLRLHHSWPEMSMVNRFSPAALLL
jgi:hypothetical protein